MNELIAATGGGRLVPPDDPESLATTLCELLLDPTERQRLGVEGRDRVCRTLHAGAMAKRTLEAWTGGMR